MTEFNVTTENGGDFQIPCFSAFQKRVKLLFCSRQRQQGRRFKMIKTGLRSLRHVIQIWTDGAELSRNIRGKCVSQRSFFSCLCNMDVTNPASRKISICNFCCFEKMILYVLLSHFRQQSFKMHIIHILLWVLILKASGSIWPEKMKSLKVKA